MSVNGDTPMTGDLMNELYNTAWDAAREPDATAATVCEQTMRLASILPSVPDSLDWQPFYVALSIANEVATKKGLLRPGQSIAGVATDEAAADLDPDAPFAISFDEFIADVQDAPPPLIGDAATCLLPAYGFGIMFAPGGKGKTTAAVDLAMHAACGTPWLDFPIERPLRVLFIENEGSREPFRAKLEAKRESWPLPISGALYVATIAWSSVSLKHRETVERLREFIDEHDIDLVIGDPLDSLGLDGVGSPEDTRAFLAMLREAGLFSSVAFLLLHHSKKSADEKDEGDEISGAWMGRPDLLMRLAKKPGNKARLSFPKVRWSRTGNLPAFLLAFDPDAETFTKLDEESDEERDLVAEVFAYVKAHPWCSAKEIAAPQPDGIGARRTTIDGILQRHPEHYRCVTGDEARAVGRHYNATAWALVEGAPESAEGEDDPL